MEKFRKTLFVLLALQIVSIVTTLALLRIPNADTDTHHPSWVAAIPSVMSFSFAVFSLAAFAGLVVSGVYIVWVLLGKAAADMRVAALMLGTVLLQIPYHEFSLRWMLSHVV